MEIGIVMSKKVYFNTTETVVRKRKGWVEVDTDFTQVYDCFSHVVMKIKSLTTIRLLFWLLSKEMGRGNAIHSGRIVYDRFVGDLEQQRGERVTLRGYTKCFKELVGLGLLTKTGRGYYYFNPRVFWRDGKESRKGFIEAEAQEERFTSSGTPVINIMHAEVEKLENQAEQIKQDDISTVHAAFRRAQEKGKISSVK